jgi:hypothetical protein
MKHKSEQLKHKIIVISDSQARGCAAKVKYNLKE